MKTYLYSTLIVLLLATACQHEPDRIEVESLELIPCMSSAQFFEFVDSINVLVRNQSAQPKPTIDSNSLDDFYTRDDSFEIAFPFTARLKPNIEQREDGHWYVRESSVVGYAHFIDTSYINEILSQNEIKVLIGYSFKPMWILQNNRDGYCALTLLIGDSKKLNSKDYWTSPLLFAGDEFIDQNISMKIADELYDINTYDLKLNLVLQSTEQLYESPSNLLKARSNENSFYVEIQNTTDTQNLVLIYGLRRQDLKKITAHDNGS